MAMVSSSRRDFFLSPVNVLMRFNYLIIGQTQDFHLSPESTTGTSAFKNTILINS